MARVLGLKQLWQKTYKFLEGLSAQMIWSFGQMTDSFTMIIWGASGAGKSNLILQLLSLLMKNGNVLYVGLEEGTEFTMRKKVFEHMSLEAHNGKIVFADHEMTYDELTKRLMKKKSPRFIVIDSVQYWNIDYEQYKALKERFKRKSFIYISHAKGKEPLGATAQAIRYDAGIKVHVIGYLAFVVSRFGGNNPYVIWEEGAKRYWGKKFRKLIEGRPAPEKKEIEQLESVA